VLEYRIEETGGRVEVAGLPSVEADPLQMRQVFQNLIGNALKFHRPDAPPVVIVRAAEEGPERVTIRVEDNGIGFEERFLERIFQPFVRLQGRFGYEGNGMGLAICRKIVERHGGTLTAQSTPEVGSKFLVTLPRRQAGGQGLAAGD
jgi:signal transduction histidine kinase